MRHHPVCVIILYILIANITLPVFAETFPFTQFDVDVPGARFTVPTGLNDAGQIVGYYIDSTGNPHGFLFSEGEFTTIDVPGAHRTAALGINNAGQIVGNFTEQGVGSFGFLRSSDGNFTTIDAPNAWYTSATDINDVGQIVGSFGDEDDPFSETTHGFLRSSDGNFTTISAWDYIQKGWSTYASGINNAGQIVGSFDNDGFGGGAHGFLLSGSNFAILDPPGASGINDTGDIVGSDGQKGFLLTEGEIITPDEQPLHSFNDINNEGTIVGTTGRHGFVAKPPVLLLDPVPELLDGSAITKDYEQLATKSQGVRGVAADGVTQLVLRIKANTVGQEFSLTLLNDQKEESTSADEDGAVARVGDTSFTDHSVVVSAADTSYGPVAFAIYRAPTDFPRVSRQDSGAAERSVYIRLQDLTTNDTSEVPIKEVPIKIVRPPVILVHGNWDNADNCWKDEDYGTLSRDKRFFIRRVNYGNLISGFDFTNPSYKPEILNPTRSSALGLSWNSSIVHYQIQGFVNEFRIINKVAAVQADIVAHSMGGLITRHLSLLPDFLENRTYGQGCIHKLITIDTPHLGSPLAIQLLLPDEDEPDEDEKDKNACVRKLLADEGNIAFRSVSIAGKGWNGSINDLQGDDRTGEKSSAISDLQSRSVLFPTAFVAGAMNDGNLSGLDCTFSSDPSLGFLCPAQVIRHFCGNRFTANPLAQKLTAEGWPTIFGQDSDAMVSVVSQFNGETDLAAQAFNGAVHSDGVTKLSFNGPTSLDDPGFIARVVQLLNTWVKSAEFRDS